MSNSKFGDLLSYLWHMRMTQVVFEHVIFQRNKKGGARKNAFCPEFTSTMSALEDFEGFIRDKVVKERLKHKQISAFLEETSMKFGTVFL